jgi:hypothetical protein
MLVLLALNLTACGLKRLLPEGPALKEKQRDKILNNSPATKVSYTGAAKVDFPILPIQVWAATYDLDIVIVSDNPLWNMHELARLPGPDGPIWIMKDALDSTMEQSIIANLPEVQEWLPEIPVKRKYYPVEVKDSSTDKMLKLHFKYENLAGELCEIYYEGKRPTTKRGKRNGSTMGHSRSQIMAVLDLPFLNFGKKTSISFDGKPAKVRKVLGLIPFRMALIQTQAGMSIGHYRQYKDGDKYITEHLDKEVKTVQEWMLQTSENKTTFTHNGLLRNLVYEYKGTDTLELQRAWVDLKYPEHRAFEIHFSPALPDLRRPFEGTVQSTFIMDVNGQKSHAYGIIEASWTKDGPQLRIIPQAPWWVKDRPMESLIRFDEKESSEITIKRIPETK